MEDHLVDALAALVPGPEDGRILVGGVGEGVELASGDLAHRDQMRARERVGLGPHHRLAELMERAVDQEVVEPARDGHRVLSRDGSTGHRAGPAQRPVNWGGRLSLNACTPSLWSAVSRTTAIWEETRSRCVRRSRRMLW